MYNLVLLVVPALTLLGVLAEGVEPLVGHVAELALLVRHKARSDGVRALAKVGGAVRQGPGLDETGLVDHHARE